MLDRPDELHEAERGTGQRTRRQIRRQRRVGPERVDWLGPDVDGVRIRHRLRFRLHRRRHGLPNRVGDAVEAESAVVRENGHALRLLVEDSRLGEDRVAIGVRGRPSGLAPRRDGQQDDRKDKEQTCGDGSKTEHGNLLRVGTEATERSRNKGHGVTFTFGRGGYRKLP